MNGGTLRRSLIPQRATPCLVAPFGLYIGAALELPVFAEWPGVSVHGAFPTHIGDGGEMLSVRMDASQFPAKIELLERHFLHAQTFLPANGQPFVMVLGRQTQDGLPEFSSLHAFVFDDSSGIALHPGTWHAFPLAVGNDTRLTVVLRHEAHLDLLTEHAFEMDARGPDLERHTIGHLVEIVVEAPVTGAG